MNNFSQNPRVAAFQVGNPGSAFGVPAVRDHFSCFWPSVNSPSSSDNGFSEGR